MVSRDQTSLTPRYWAVLGVVRLTRGPVSPEKIAKELRFSRDEVDRLLSDLRASGYIPAD